MKTVDANGLEWRPYPGQRSLAISYKPLLRGEAGSPSNYEMSVVRISEGGSLSPRHRHNFDQFRWAIGRPMNYSPKLDVMPDNLGYFPEGAYYGPQDLPDGTQFMIVQFGGPSGDGYMSWDELMRGYNELCERGEFKGGVFRGVRPNGDRFNKDGYEAIWEHVHHNQEIRYVTPRYREPVMMNPDAFEWVASEQPGIRLRSLGTFGDRGTAAHQVMIGEGASYGGPHRHSVTLAMVARGQVEVCGQAYAEYSAFEIEPDEVVEIGSEGGAVLLELDMPRFS